MSPSVGRRVRRRRRVGLAFAVVVLTVAILVSFQAQRESRRGPVAKPLPGPSLRKLAKADDLLLGTALRDQPLRDEPGYRKDLVGEFAAISPENAMKWDALEPERGKFTWGGADRAVDFAAKHGLKVRGHTLVWHAQLPGWLTGGDFDRGGLLRLMTGHVKRVMGRYKGRVKAWDVVNEAVAEDGSLRQSLWGKELGPGFIAAAFEAARKADPKARLAINEIGAESTGPKSDTLLRIVRELKRQGLVDEVGFQAHFNLDGVPETMEANLKRFAALGVDIAITEADVGVPDDAGPEALDAQAKVYAELVKTCRAVPRCRALTVWGYTDRHSWIPDNQPGTGRATLLDDELAPKPAYRAFQDALRGS